jgi:hypothetical protein
LSAPGWRIRRQPVLRKTEHEDDAEEMNMNHEHDDDLEPEVNEGATIETENYQEKVDMEESPMSPDATTPPGSPDERPTSDREEGESKDEAGDTI